MSARVSAGLAASALIRRAHECGGSAMVLKRGDVTAGAIIVECREPGGPATILERRLDAAFRYAWCRIESQGADNQGENDGYLARASARDPDLWIIELVIPDAERFVVESALFD